MIFLVMYAGYTIPKGMIVMVSPSTVHLNSDKYEDPLAFNPWRWKVVYGTNSQNNIHITIFIFCDELTFVCINK